MDGALSELARNYGISTEFWDWQGHQRLIEESTIIGILAAMNVDASSPEAIQQAIAEKLERPWRRALPPVVVLRQSTPERGVAVHLPHGESVELTLRLEHGQDVIVLEQVENLTDPRIIDGVEIGEATFWVPADLPVGYHRLSCHTSSSFAETTLIVTPDALPLPSRGWGYAAQLYSIRSENNWGFGDFQDLADLATWSATQQFANYVLINPIHAAQSAPPLEPSPYLPSTRRYVNPLYLRPEAIREYALLNDYQKAEIEALRLSVADDPRGQTTVLRNEVWLAKLTALKMIHELGLRPARKMALEQYRREQGRALSDFATWWVLCHHLGEDWRTWPEEYRRPTSPEVSEFRTSHAEEIAFAEWLQWVAQVQLSSAQDEARNAGMRYGICCDLAVGVNKSGAETWMMPDLYAHGVSVGAPPDAYNQLGQDWGQPPWRPDRLAELGYSPFRDLVRGALAHAGGIRIDHIIGMFRLWWILEGDDPNRGAYVYYDHEALIGIIALEAQRADAVVIGEDLGTVEDWVRDYLISRGILGTSVAWFEQWDGSPLPAEVWRSACMASVTTHDLPPTAGFLAFEQVRIRAELGLLTEPFEEELNKARREQDSYLNFLRERGYLREVQAGNELSPPADEAEAIMLALHRFLVATPARLLNAALVDAVGERRAQNQPGTVDEYPNWRVPLGDASGRPLLLEEIYRSKSAMRLASVMNDFTNVAEPWA